MKKYLLWICAAAALLTAGASCSDDPDVDSVGRVGIQQESLTASGAGEELTLNVTSNAYWHIEFVDPKTNATIRWISASEVNGRGNSVVKLTVARNRSTSERSASVNIVTDSESSSASIPLSQGAGTIGGGDGYDFPMYQMFSIDGSLALDNAFIEGAVCYFDDGMILRRTGSPVAMTFSTQTHTNPKENWYFQRGVVIGSWKTDDALQLEIPLKEALSGDLRYSYGSRRDGTQSAGHAWAFEWSADGEQWTLFDGTSSGGASDAVWKVIDFTIPAQKQIPAGGKLWIRHRCTNGDKASTSATNSTIAFQTGFCITKTSAALTEIPAMDDETVVFSTGFDDVANAKAAYIDLPLDFMSSWHAGAYSLPKEQAGIVNITDGRTRPGFLQVGGGDEATTKYTQGAYEIKVKPRFEAMNILKSDLKLTFRASAMINAYGTPTDPGVVVSVDSESGATVDNAGKVEGVANNEFKEFTVYVRNAVLATEIKITSAAMSSKSDDVRFFLDDILLKVEGTPERPSATDPVKAEVSEIRALKGPSAVTISDNLYIQGRVVAVDNVPADCFALADDNAGIFVKLANHGFAVGETAKVVVKGAGLAVDTDGLLVVTPTAGDHVSKVQGTAQMPAAKAISVADLKAGTYEAMYVELPASQVIGADLTKTMSGSLTLELADLTTTYTMKTYAEASFAAAAAPKKSGAVKGLAGASRLLPTALTDLAAMTGTRFGETVYAIKAISGLLKVSRDGDVYGFRNVTYADNVVTYSSPEGCMVTKIGNEGVAGCKLANTGTATIYDGRFLTTGWGGDDWQKNGLVFKIKATSRIVGNLRFGFGLFAAVTQAVPKNWKIAWSNDNVSWNTDVRVLETPFTGEGSESFALTTQANTRGYRMACFNVPESKAIAQDGFIYVKIMQADNTTCHASGKEISTAGELLFQHGFYLATHEKRAYHTSNLPSGTNVLLTEGFDDAFLAHDYFVPSWQMWTNVSAAYTMPEGWVKAGDVSEGVGYIRVGKNGADEESSITTPALTALGAETANVTLKFKIGVGLGGKNSFLPDACIVTITTEGGGTAGTLTPDLSSLLPQGALETINNSTAPAYENAYHRWHEVSVPITGATKDTTIKIGGEGRHFIDDVVILRD